MLTIKKLKPRIYEVTLSGTVTASDIDLMKRELTPPLQADGKMGMVVRIEDLDDITGDALIADARVAPNEVADAKTRASDLSKPARDTGPEDDAAQRWARRA